MLRAIITLAHNLGIWAVAEGIETDRQYELLRLARCRYGQGFLFSRPVPAAELSELASTSTSYPLDPARGSTPAGSPTAPSAAAGT